MTGAEIKHARIRSGLTQAELGRKLGVTRGTVSNWETDVSFPGSRHTSRLAEILGVKGSRAAVAVSARPCEGGRAATSRRTPGLRDNRLPPVGTVLRKVGRDGQVCQATVVAGGIKYKGEVYGSPSGAAVAAAADLGHTAERENGYIFWGLKKGVRPATRSTLPPSDGRGRRLHAQRTTPDGG